MLSRPAYAVAKLHAKIAFPGLYRRTSVGSEPVAIRVFDEARLDHKAASPLRIPPLSLF